MHLLTRPLFFSGFMKHVENGKRVEKRSIKTLMNVEIFTLIDYSIFKKFVDLSVDCD